MLSAMVSGLSISAEKAASDLPKMSSPSGSAPAVKVRSGRSEPAISVSPVQRLRNPTLAGTYCMTDRQGRVGDHEMKGWCS
jgi:hypothetical protein